MLAGMQRLDLQHKMLIVASALEFAVAITRLLFGWGLVGLALGHLVGQTLAISQVWLLYRRLCPQLRISAGGWGLSRIVSLSGRFNARGRAE